MRDNTLSHAWVRTPPYYPVEGAQKIGPSGHYPFKHPIDLKVSGFHMEIKNFIILYAHFKGGVQGQKSRKHDFEITGDTKVSPSGSTSWPDFEAPDSYGYLWGHALLLGPKNENDK